MDPLQSGRGSRNRGHAWAPQHGPAVTKELSSLTVAKDKKESLYHSLRKQLLVCPSGRRQHLSTQGQTPHSGTYLPSLSSGLLLASCFMDYRLLYPWLSINLTSDQGNHAHGIHSDLTLCPHSSKSLDRTLQWGEEGSVTVPARKYTLCGSALFCRK